MVHDAFLLTDALIIIHIKLDDRRIQKAQATTVQDVGPVEYWQLLLLQSPPRS